MPDPTVPNPHEGRELTQLYATRAEENVAHVIARVDLTLAEAAAFKTTHDVCSAIAHGRRA
jgi:hypothetical protein